MVNRKFWANHLESNHARSAKWRKEHPEFQQRQNQRRRARVNATPSTLTSDQWTAIVSKYKGRCAYCDKKIPKLEQDHVFPVSKGGGYTADNIVPACHDCNSRKGARQPPKPVQTLLF